MKFERDERKFDFHDIGMEIKRKREAKGMTQEQLAYVIDRDPRTVMYNENDGQHPSLNTFYQMITMFDISVDQFFYPDMSADAACKKRIDILLNSLDEKDLRLVEALIRSADHAIHVRAVHEFLQDAKLLFGAGRHKILPPFRQNGQVRDAPLDVFGIVDIGWGKLHQMTNTPADKIAVPFKVAVLTAGGTEDFGIGHGHRGLFCYN